MKSSLREKIITSYENYQNNGYINSYIKDLSPMSNMTTHCYSRNIEKIIDNWERYKDFPEYTIYYMYNILINYGLMFPFYEKFISLNQFLDNLLKNNPFIFIDDGKEINLYHLLMLLAGTLNFDNRSLRKILMLLPIKDVFSYVFYVYETRLKRNFDTKNVNYEYIYLIILLSDFCLRVCEDKLSSIYEDNDNVDLNTLNYSIISHIKNNDINKYETDESLIAIYTKSINLIDEYFIGKVTKKIFKEWFYNKTCYQRKSYMNKMICYLFKFNNDYFNKINSSDIPHDY